VSRRSEVVKKQKQDQREFIRNFKRKSRCQRCGFSDWRALQFHHRNPNEKSFSLYMVGKDYFSMARIMAEIEKCDIICANCHAIEHAPVS
jgi:hypothetical protein